MPIVGPARQSLRLLALADKGYAITPDYATENTIVHVLINTALRIIQFEESLSIFGDVCYGREKLGCFLPSWVPDWTNEEIDNGFLRYCALHSNGDRPFSASKDLPAKVEFRSDPANDANVDMKVTAVFIGRLDKLENPIRDFPNLQRFLLSSGWLVVTPRSALLDDEVWVPHGASMPVVLRPDMDGTRFGFLGEVFTHNPNGAVSEPMFGKAIEWVEQGNDAERQIWLI